MYPDVERGVIIITCGSQLLQRSLHTFFFPLQKRLPLCCFWSFWRMIYLTWYSGHWEGNKQEKSEIAFLDRMRYLIVCGWHFDYLCGWDQSPLCADINNIPGQMDRATLKHASLWRSTLKFSLVRRMKYCRDVINPRRIKVQACRHEAWYAELVGVICYMEKKSAGMLTELARNEDSPGSSCV